MKLLDRNLNGTIEKDEFICIMNGFPVPQKKKQADDNSLSSNNILFLFIIIIIFDIYILKILFL